MNNLPMGFSYSRDSDNSPLLKLIFPNMLKIGRINSRALDGPIKLPKGPGDLMKKVEKAYNIFYKIWNITMVPKLLKMHKWFDGKGELAVDDVVYFQKQESELSSKWTIGRVYEVVKGRDDIVRRATVQYQNYSEDAPRLTDRAARSLIKLFNIDDVTWQQDMDEVARLLEEVEDPKNNNDESVDKPKAATEFTMSHTGEGLKYRLVQAGYEVPSRDIGVQNKPAAKVARAKIAQPCKDCCCFSHCVLTDHGKNLVSAEVPEYDEVQEHKFVNLLDRSWQEFDVYKEDMFSAKFLEQDQFMSLLTAVNTDFGDMEEE